MSRKSRIVIAGNPHHITQRGNRRQVVFFTDDDRGLYLDLLRFYTKKHGVYVLAYCLMTNHVHHVLIPEAKDGLANVLKPLHMRYAQEVNSRMDWTGHLWQARFFSSALDQTYFWTALRYVERNPVEARLVEHAASYLWSSAAGHCGLREDPILNYPKIWKDELAKVKDWFNWLIERDDTSTVTKLRAHTQRDLPVGSNEFLDTIERNTGRFCQPRASGRPPVARK